MRHCNSWIRYGFALLMAIATFLIAGQVAPAQPLYSLPMLTAMLAAILLGPGPAAMTVASAAILEALLWQRDGGGVWRPDVIVFLLAGSAAVWMSERLRRSRARMRELLDSIGDSFLLLDAKLRIRYANRQSEGILQRTPTELTGIDYFRAYPKIRERLEQTRITGTASMLDYFDEPSQRWFEIRTFPAAGGVAATLRDITGAKENRARLEVARTELLAQERRLRASETWLHDALRAGRMGMWNMDATTLAVEGSPELHELLGAPPGDLDGPLDRLLERVAPADRECLLDGIQRMLRGEACECVVHTHVPDSAPRWLLARGIPFRDDAGKVVRLSGFAVDVTEAKTAELALRESEARFRAMADSAPVLIWTADPEGARESFNLEWRKLTGLPEAAQTGDRWRASVHPDDLQHVALAIASQCGRTTCYEIEYRLRAADGGWRWLLERSGPRLRPDGSLAGYIGACVDITERREIEERLRDSQKLESIGVLAGGVAHDFNNLLTGILGNTSLVLGELGEDHEHAERLHDVIAASERAADLTRQLLAYAGKGRFVQAPVDLSREASDIVRLVRSSIPASVDLRLTLAEGLPAVMADPGQMQQLLMNLIINAAEAVGQGPGSVTVATSAVHVDRESIQAHFPGQWLEPGPHIRVTVHDTGCGMNPETQRRIFEPFFSTKFHGRGLGLSATLGIVRSQKGGIRVYSVPDKGSTFQILLPAAAASPAPPPPIDESRLHGSGAILVIDDEYAVRRLAEAALVRFGYRVLAAGGAEEALRLYREHHVEVRLVLLDLTLPSWNAAQVYAGLRAIRPSVRVLISSGFSEAEAERQFGGARLPFLQKPYSATRLAEVVQMVLERATAAAS